jgi:D-serine deaminase-like pyridoxal phosphate-dependent protein
MQVTKLNDQHAFVRLPEDDPLAVGDRLGCGLAHPCTVFDKWRVIPVVDEGYRVLEVVETAF